MKSILLSLAGVLGLLALATAAPSSASTQDDFLPTFFFKNACPFDLFVREAVGEAPGSRPDDHCEHFGESPTYFLPAGVITGAFQPLRKDSCGHSFKVSREPNGPVYQYEYNYARENGKIWYNLSHNDGNIFTDFVRQFGARKCECPVLTCEAGNDGSACDDPMMVVCDTIVDWMAVLCGKLVERGDDWDMKAVGTNFQQEVVMLEDLEVVEV